MKLFEQLLKRLDDQKREFTQEAAIARHRLEMEKQLEFLAKATGVLATIEIVKQLQIEIPVEIEYTSKEVIESDEQVKED